MNRPTKEELAAMTRPEFAAFVKDSGIRTVSDLPDPQPLPEDDPRRIEWLARLMSRQLNPDGAPLPSVRQSQRQPPRWDRPWIERGPTP